jgi:predicted homoserine dehydrogenase-like protein
MNIILSARNFHVFLYLFSRMYLLSFCFLYLFIMQQLKFEILLPYFKLLNGNYYNLFRPYHYINCFAVGLYIRTVCLFYDMTLNYESKQSM